MHVRRHVCIYVRMCVYVYVYICMCVCVYVCVCVCVCVSVCVHNSDVVSDFCCKFLYILFLGPLTCRM